MLMPVSKLKPKQIEQVTEWVATYIADQRSSFLKRARPIPPELVNSVQPFFSKDILSGVQVVRGRAGEPAFYSQLREMGIRNPPAFSDMAGITFQDVVVHIEPLTAALLFHELVHAVQYKHLGLRGFAERYVCGFLNGGSYEEIPLEKQAYGLENNFVGDASIVFSVEDNVKDWIRLDRL
jgi:hypothetical protein